jgi:lysophospholipase L1-like esterase
MWFSSPKFLNPLLLAATALAFSSTVFGQTLSIVKQSESKYQIEASAPADNPHALQASENLHLWIDVQEEVTGRYSQTLTNFGSFRYFRLKPSESAPPIRIMLLGDSLGSDCCGWGQGFYGYLKPNAVFVNYAIPNTSTKVFLQSAEKDNMLLIKPDYVLINHGYIDNALGQGSERSFTTLEEFQVNLKVIVEMVRSFGGVPIMVAVQAPRVWDANGNVIGGWMERNAIAKRVAIQLNVAFLDLDRLTRDLYFELGPTGTAFMNWFQDDYMHFSPAGAKVVARLVANALPDELGPYLSGIFDPPPMP